MRITNNMLIRNMMLNINTNLVRMDKVQYQMATGKKIRRPSDDPIIASRALKYRTDIYEIEQFQKNTSDAISWIEMTEQALSNLGEVIKRARELTVQASTDSLTPEDKIKIQSEIIQLKRSIVEIGNTSYAGRYIFGGYDTDEPPFAIENTSIGEKITYRGKYLSLGGPVSGTVNDADIQEFYRNNLHKVAGQPELMMGNLLSFEVFASGAGADFDITLTEETNETTRTIRIPQGSYDTGNINELVSALQAAIDDDVNGFGTFTLDGQDVSKIKVGTDPDGKKIVFTVQNGDAIRINKTPKPNGLDIEKIGFEDGVRSRQVGDSTYQLTMNFIDFTATATESRFDIVLDSGQVLEIDLPAGDYTLEDMVAELNNQLDGTGITVSAVDGQIRFESTVEGFTIRENGYALDLSRLGYADGVKSARNQLQSIEYEVGVG
ncbi:MAG: flagellar hook-associated protein FlgL, partial [Clostridiaceae bacterium]|nr:flagellar hook-associated protein FlgL [Clostridiaceae bacterium]